jgi:hypothetical protein
MGTSTSTSSSTLTVDFGTTDLTNLVDVVGFSIKVGGVTFAVSDLAALSNATSVAQVASVVNTAFGAQDPYLFVTVSGSKLVITDPLGREMSDTPSEGCSIYISVTAPGSGSVNYYFTPSQTVVTDLPPHVTSFKLTDGASNVPVGSTSNVPVGSNIVFTFDEAIQRGDGTISIGRNISGSSLLLTLRDSANPADLTSFAVNGVAFKFDGFSYTVGLTSGVQSTYQAFVEGLNAALHTNPALVSLSAGLRADNTIAIYDPLGRSFVTYGFTFVGNLVPAAGTLAWGQRAEGFATSFIVAEAFNVASSPRLSVSGNALTINPTADLAYDTAYSVNLGAGAISDLAGNSDAGITGYNFTTSAAPDTSAPVVLTFSPADEATNVAVASNIVVTFSEHIYLGSGNIVLKTATGATVASYGPASSNLSIVNFLSGVLTINPSADLAYSTVYKLEFGTGAVKDSAGNVYAGTTTYNFATQSAPNQIFASTVGNDALNGGAGTDTAIFSGKISDYFITYNRALGTATITDHRAVGDGTDSLKSIEKLQFSDKTFDLINLPPTQTPTYGKADSFLFDSAYYLLKNPDLSPSVTLVSAVNNFISTGALQGKAPNTWFDPVYYENKWPDLFAANLSNENLFKHYNLFGVWEGRSAGPAFDKFNGSRYLADNPDVAAYVDASLSSFLGSRSNGAIAHYIIYGSAEGRVAYGTDGKQIDLSMSIGSNGTTIGAAYGLSSNISSANEGGTASFTISTINVAAGTKLRYTVSGTNITAADLADGKLLGTATVGLDGKATIPLTLAADKLTEGGETLTVTVQGQSAAVAIGDTSTTPVVQTPTYALSASSATVDEGGTVKFTIITSNVPAGTVLGYSLFGNNITATDVVGGTLMGQVTIGENGNAEFSVVLSEDQMTEGPETLTAAVANQSASVAVVDISLIGVPSGGGGGGGDGGGGGGGGGG